MVWRHYTSRYVVVLVTSEDPYLFGGARPAACANTLIVFNFVQNFTKWTTLAVHYKFQFYHSKKKKYCMAKSMIVQVVTFKLPRHYVKISRAWVTNMHSPQIY